MPRYYTPSPSPSPDRHRAASRSRTAQRARSRSRFSEVSSSSRGDNRRALDRPATRGSLRSRRHSDDSGSYRSGRSRSRSSSDSSRRHTRRNADRSRSRPPRSRSRDAKDAPTSSSKFIDKKDKIPLGFLAGIGVSAVLLHKFWPKGWLHGDEKYWDRLGRDKRDKVDDAVRVKRERAEAALRHGGESVREHVGPAYDGFREGYVRERDGRDRLRASDARGDRPPTRESSHHADPRRRRSVGDDDARRRRPVTPRDGRYPPPPDMVPDHVYDMPPPPGARRYADPRGDWYQDPRAQRPQQEYRYR